jgi:hypothetical protein
VGEEEDDDEEEERKTEEARRGGARGDGCGRRAGAAGRWTGGVEEKGKKNESVKKRKQGR